MLFPSGLQQLLWWEQDQGETKYVSYNGGHDGRN